MKFSVIQQSNHSFVRDQLEQLITSTLLFKGHQMVSSDKQINFVLNLTDINSPKIFKRKSRSIFVISLIEANTSYQNLQAVCYRTLVRTLSNLLICIVDQDRDTPNIVPKVFFTTPEAGFYEVPMNADSIYKAILPVIGAHFFIDNRIDTDLPEPFWNTSPVIEQFKYYSKILDKMGVLPAPFPLTDVLESEDIAHLYQLFEMKGLSYGNLSARENIPELGKNTFWMTARGINKSNIKIPGKDLLLVKGIDKETGKILVSTSPHQIPDSKVSVDAIEHALIYQEYPEVGAIVHVHAWMDSIVCTRQNYPCGTIELAEEVVNLLGQIATPCQTVIGLKNHGLTITGLNLEDIFQRIQGQLILQIPMFS